MPWEPLPGKPDGDPATMGKALDRLMRNLGSPKLETVRSVFDRWAELVGEQVAARAQPIALRDGVLSVGVEDPAWATQLRFLEAELLRQIAEEFGPDEVRAIEVRVRPRGAGPARARGRARPPPRRPEPGFEASARAAGGAADHEQKRAELIGPFCSRNGPGMPLDVTACW
jgi:hypothetical protein